MIQPDLYLQPVQYLLDNSATEQEASFVAKLEDILRDIYDKLAQSTVPGTTTVVNVANGLFDADMDTGIWVEKTPDEDYIRMQTYGIEAFVINNAQDAELTAGSFAIPSGEKLIFEGLLGDTYWTYNSATAYLEGWVDGTKRIEM